MSDRTPFIPAKLDDAELTPHEFRLFCRIARRGDCTESVGGIASATNMHSDTVRAGLKTLRRAQMIETVDRPGTTNIHRVNPPSEWSLTVLEEDHPSEKEGGVEDNNPSENDGGVESHPCDKDGGAGCENEGGDKYHPSDNDGGDPCEMNGDHPSENKGGASKGTPLEGTPLEGKTPDDEAGSAPGRESSDPWGFLPEDDRVYQPTMEDSADEFSPTSVDRLIRRHWGGYRQGKIPISSMSGVLDQVQDDHGDGEGFRRFVAAVVIAGDQADTPNLKFVRSTINNFDRYRDRDTPRNGHSGSGRQGEKQTRSEEDEWALADG